MDYEIKIAVNPEVDIDKLNKIVKSIDERFSSLKKIELFDAKSIDEMLKKIPQRNELSVLSSTISPSNEPFIGAFEQNLKARKEEDLYYNELQLEQKLINEQQFLDKKTEINKKYIDDLNDYLKSADSAIQQPNKYERPSAFGVPGRTLQAIEDRMKELAPQISKDLAEDAEVEKFDENSLKYAEAIHALNLKRAKAALKAGEIDDEDFREITAEIKRDFELAKIRNKYYMKDEEINANEDLTPLEAAKALYDNSVEEAKAYFKAKLIDKETFEEALEDIKQEWKDRKDEFLNPKSKIPLLFERDDKELNYKEGGEIQSSNAISNNLPFAMDMRDMDIDNVVNAWGDPGGPDSEKIAEEIARAKMREESRAKKFKEDWEAALSKMNSIRKLSEAELEAYYSNFIDKWNVENPLNEWWAKQSSSFSVLWFNFFESLLKTKSLLSENIKKAFDDFKAEFNTQKVPLNPKRDLTTDEMKILYGKDLENWDPDVEEDPEISRIKIQEILNKRKNESGPMKMDMREFDIDDPTTLYKGKPFTDQIKRYEGVISDLMPSEEEMDDLLEMQTDMNDLAVEFDQRMDKFDLNTKNDRGTDDLVYDKNDWEDEGPDPDDVELLPPNTVFDYKDKKKSENIFGTKDALDVFDKLEQMLDDIYNEEGSDGHEHSNNEIARLDKATEAIVKKLKVKSPSYSVLWEIWTSLADKYDTNDDAIMLSEEVEDFEGKDAYTKEFRADFEEAVISYMNDFIPKYNDAIAESLKPAGDESKQNLEIPKFEDFVADFFYDPSVTRPDEDSSYNNWQKFFNNGDIIQWIKDRGTWRKDGKPTNSSNSDYPKEGNIVGYENLGKGFEDVSVLAAISENWDTASNTLADEQSLLNYFAAIKKVNESPEMAMIRENWDTGSNTPGQEDAYLKYIGFEKERNTNRFSQPINISPKNQLPPKMMMSDIELSAIYAEFEGDNENYRDQELAANQKMLDDKLIAEEQFLENRLRILQNFEDRKSEVSKYIDNADSISTSETTTSADISDKDTEEVAKKKATEKPAKVFDAMHSLIADRGGALKTATKNLTLAIGDTLGGLFEGNDEKLKDGSKKLLKTLGDLIKKVASAAITNIVLGQLGITGSTTGFGAIFAAPAILAVVSGVVSALIDPIVNGLTMKTGGRADVPTGVVIGDNPYSPEWVLRDFDIQAIIDTALQKAFKSTSAEINKSNDIQSDLIEIIKTQERYSQANNFFNTGETLLVQNPNQQGNFQNSINIDTSQIIKNLEQLNEQFSQFEGRIHVVESEVAHATNNFNNRINRRSYI